MNFIGFNLKEWVSKLRDYISDDRPLNIDEMRNLADIIDSVRVPAKRIVNQIPDKMIHYSIQNDWRNFKQQLG